MADLQIQNPSITSGAFASMLAFSGETITAISGHPIGGSGGGGTPSDGYWRPSVNEAGVISWQWSTSPTSTVPASVDIMGPSGAQGPEGPQGPSGNDGQDGTSIILQSVTDVEGGKEVTLAWGETPTTSSFVIPSGDKGADGQDGLPGIDGISPTISTSAIDDDPTRPQGGTHVVISGAGGEESFDVWNGVDGTGATISLSGGKGIQIDHPAGTTTYGISVSSDYMEAPTPVAGHQKNYLWFSKVNGGVDESEWVDADNWLNAYVENGVILSPDDLPWYFEADNGISGEWDESEQVYRFGLSAKYLSAVSADSTLSGDGVTSALGINTENTYSLDGVDPIIVTSGAGNKTIIKATDAAVSALNAVTQNKQVWDSASAKSTVTINSATNVITVEGDPNSAISATTYYPRPTNNGLFAAQRIFMVETDNDIYACMNHTDGQGCLFFMLSARS